MTMDEKRAFIAEYAKATAPATELLIGPHRAMLNLAAFVAIVGPIGLFVIGWVLMASGS